MIPEELLLRQEEHLERGLHEMGLLVEEETRKALLDYLALLSRWNTKYNLTAVRDPVEMVGRHLLDSLSVLGKLPSGPVLDVGTGAGLPGIPLALVEDQKKFVLLDANSKKTNFVQYAITSLKLANVKVMHERVEKYRPNELFPVVISRAFADLRTFVEKSGHLCRAGGVLMAMKGRQENVELNLLPDGFFVLRVESLQVPGVVGERCLVTVKKRN